MTRQITIKLHGAMIMLDLQFEKRDNTIVYRIVGNKNFQGQVPDGFEIIREEYSNEPKFDEQSLSEEGIYIVLQVWQEIKGLPTQFQGGVVQQ